MKQKKTSILGRVFVLISVVLSVFVGGYLFLNFAIIPKYFGQYGIKDVPDLVGVVASLYKSPNEKKLIKNPYTTQDLTSAINTLQQANYKISNDGTVIESEFKGDLTVVLTDREVAALCNQLIDNGILIDALPSLNYLNMINISVLEVLITPDKNSKDGNYYTKANLEFIAKLETVDIREQIAEHMNTPLFLLNMIIPDNLYFLVSYDIDLSKAENERVSNETIALNGRTAEQSEILMNLLIDFIFPEEDAMNLEKFTHNFGDIILQGIDVFGDFKFTYKGYQAGIYVNPLEG